MNFTKGNEGRDKGSKVAVEQASITRLQRSLNKIKLVCTELTFTSGFPNKAMVCHLNLTILVIGLNLSIENTLKIH